MIKIDPGFMIHTLFGGLVGGVMTYLTSRKKVHDGLVSGYVDGGTMFVRDLREALEKHRKVILEEADALLAPSFHDRILNECYGKNDTLQRFYQEISDASDAIDS